MTTAGPAWIYALPGSNLAPGLPAGAPAFEDLEGQPGDWRALLLYGPPPLALATLAMQGGDLGQWRRQLHLAGQLKRRHRQRIRLLNTARVAPAEEAELQRAWPELRRADTRGKTTSWPDSLLTLAAQTVLRLDPALRAAYLDLEAESDGGAGEATDIWRHEPRADDWLQALRQLSGGEGSQGPAAERRGVDLNRQLRRHEEWLKLLCDQEVQLENELAKHLATAQAMAALLPLLERQLARARRALEQAP